MKKLSIIVLCAMFAAFMVSCGGDKGAKGNPFGKIPSLVKNLMDEGEKLKKDAENMKSLGDMAKLISKGAKLASDFKENVDKAAPGVIGNELPTELAEGTTAITIVAPMAIEKVTPFNDFVTFTTKGKVALAADCDLNAEANQGKKFINVKCTVLDKEGQPVEGYENRAVGNFDLAKLANENNVVVKGTEIEINKDLKFSDKSWEKLSEMSKIVLTCE